MRKSPCNAQGKELEQVSASPFIEVIRVDSLTSLPGSGGADRTKEGARAETQLYQSLLAFALSNISPRARAPSTTGERCPEVEFSAQQPGIHTRLSQAAFGTALGNRQDRLLTNLQAGGLAILTFLQLSFHVPGTPQR